MRPVIPVLTKKQIKGLLAITGPIDEERAWSYGIGSRQHMDVIHQYLRMASSGPYGQDYRDGMGGLALTRRLMARRLHETYPPHEAQARAACGLSFAYRYAHARPLRKGIT